VYLCIGSIFRNLRNIQRVPYLRFHGDGTAGEGRAQRTTEARRIYFNGQQGSEILSKRKIINDPLYGFITLNPGLLSDLIEHPYFQRLRYIKQLGLTDLVYPGALHTRFQHALGAMHLMGRVLEDLRTKAVEISPEEGVAAQVAVLLHDVGHGPFSHALEQTLLPGMKHESLSYLFMKQLNHEYNGALDLALRIFQNTYPRKFFHQLINSQLDIDRLDYLKRDSFFTGVTEGSIGADRIITLLRVVDDQLVVDEKGIYSIESFLHARRLMYWQVYLHKTSVSAERLIVNIIKRAQYLFLSGESLSGSEPLKTFLKNKYTFDDFRDKPDLVNAFGQLDDNDIWGAIKSWRSHGDPILSQLCEMLLTRNLFQIQLTTEPINKNHIDKVRAGVVKTFHILRGDAPYLFSHGVVSNEGYVAEGQTINVLTKSGNVVDIAHASDLPSIKAISKIVKKNYLCWPKNVSL
jgi:HD superfamily phosphohydrolase